MTRPSLLPASCAERATLASPNIAMHTHPRLRNIVRKPLKATILIPREFAQMHLQFLLSIHPSCVATALVLVRLMQCRPPCDDHKALVFFFGTASLDTNKSRSSPYTSFPQPAFLHPVSQAILALSPSPASLPAGGRRRRVENCSRLLRLCYV